jgi:hypothetical protein
MAADAAGLSFEELVARIVDLAVAQSGVATKSR